jgi:hypothetical protein
MVTLGIGKSPRNSAVLPFYGAGTLFFLALTVLMFIAADSFKDHFFNQYTLALVHTAALGWGTMIIFGAAYQLMPVIFEEELYSSKMAFISFWFLLIGSIILIISFWFFQTGLVMISGGASILIAVILYNINVFNTAVKSTLTIQKLFLMVSAFWLFATVTVGVLLAINLYYPYIPFNHLEILKLHAHIGFVGWFLQLITGVSSKLVPMFLFGKSNKSNLLKVAFVFQNIGLVAFLIDDFFIGASNRVYIYYVLVLIGICFWLAYIFDVYKNRLKKKVDIQMRHTFLSMVALSAALLLIPVVLTGHSNQWSMLYGSFIFLGWISAIIFGKTFKTLPFIIWNMHYKDVHGKKNMPLPRDLYVENLLFYQFWFFVAAFITLILGILLGEIIIIKAALLIWIVVALLYVFNVAKVFFHKKII